MIHFLQRNFLKKTGLSKSSLCVMKLTLLQLLRLRREHKHHWKVVKEHQGLIASMRNRKENDAFSLPRHFTWLYHIRIGAGDRHAIIRLRAE